MMNREMSVEATLGLQRSLRFLDRSLFREQWRWPLLVVLSLFLLGASPGPEREERLWHHRNLGKAFYENPTTQHEAVEEFRKALELAPDSPRERLNLGLALLRAGKTAEGVALLEKVQKQAPEIPQTWFNLGIAWKRESEYDKATAQFEGMLARVPDEPVSHYQLGTLYKLTDRPELALKHFEEAARLGPHLAGPRFQLFNAYRQAGRAEDAARELAKFQEIKVLQEGAAIPEDLEWSWYSEILDEIPGSEPGSAGVPPAPSSLKLEPTELATGLDPATASLHVLDADGDTRPDLLAASSAGIHLWRNGSERIAATGLEEIRGAVAVAPGDFDNDGLPDLAVLAPVPSLWRNTGGRFERVTAPLPAGSFRQAVWLDFDHDYDVDLVLLGDGAALLRNQGPAGWSDETARFPFVQAPATAAAVLDVVSDTQGIDLAVAYAGRTGVIYRDRLGAVYEAEPLDPIPAGASFLVAEDVDHDGWTDLAVPGRLVRNERSLRGRLAAGPELPGAGPYVLADLENRGATSLVTAEALSLAPLAAIAAADFDADGRVDLATVGKDGVLRRLRNVTGGTNRWLAVGLEGVKNLKLAPGAEVEVKAGASYQKKLYRGVPLHFGLGGRAEVDTVRITWPNGLIQNEMKKAAGALTCVLAIREAPRLSGSCPMIFTWNGREFEFITDVLGVAPLGASAGDGTYFPVDHDEYVQIRGESLAPVDERYEIRITEELREVAYLDQVRLLAVDHPEDVEIFTNDKFKAPPFPEFRLFGVREKIRPVSALDHRGADVRERLLARDRVYPDGFRRNAAGIAELHSIELDFGDAVPDSRAILVLSGWVDWADGSTFLGAAQESKAGLVFPYLQVKDDNGDWKTVIDDMGIPAGKPKTIVVDLTDQFLSASRKIRIVTSLCVYWDEIFLAPLAEPEAMVTPLAPETSALRYRGFSKPVIHSERKQPERFDYQSWMPVSMWNPTPGLYTRYGDVKPLLEEIDDFLVVMGSGDEVRLLFDATALPPLRDHWRRDFLLFVDGWAKDADANTAFSQTVEPLPFHGMSQYPYPEGERFPDGEAHTRYREQHNTRPALRLLHPLRGREERPR